MSNTSTVGNGASDGRSITADSVALCVRMSTSSAAQGSAAMSANVVSAKPIFMRFDLYRMHSRSGRICSAPMSILDKILGNTPSTGAQIQVPPPRAAGADASTAPAVLAPPPPASGERPIRVYDQFGRRHEIGREAWRRDVLLP